jgi:paraquat-inducible protein B
VSTAHAAPNGAAIIMNTKTNALRIGAFVLAGLGIAVTVILLLGSGKLFSRQVPVLVYFDSSVNGLSVGAPVKFKGVPVGQVSRIQIAFDETSIQQSIPVVLQLSEDRVVSAADRQIDLGDRSFMMAQVKKGLRASLEIESFISGRLFVQLDYFEKAPPPEFRQASDTYIEIPSVSTGLTEFVESLTQTDLAGLVVDLRTLVRSMNEMIHELQITSIREELVGSLKTVRDVLQSPEITNALRSITLTSDDARQFLNHSGTNLDQATKSLATLTDETTRTLAELRRALDEVRGFVAPDSIVLAQLQETLLELSEASRSVRRFADSLQRTPSALITGRETPAKHP